MSIAQTIQSSIDNMPPGQLFGYQDLPVYAKSPSAVIKAIGRMVTSEKLKRFSKGKFYIPKQGKLGLRKPSDSELIRSMLYKNGRLFGYITGLSLYNRLGLTTQLPRTITIACNGGRQEKELGTIRIKTIVTRLPIQEENIKLLQYLDVLKDIKKIPDSDINLSLKIMSNLIEALSELQRKQLLDLAIDYYSPQTRALIGLIFSTLEFPLPDKLALSLNPTTTYKLKLDQSIWVKAKYWNIK